MDEQRRAEQIAKANELMRQLNDPVWLKQNAEIDDDGWVEAGIGLRGYVELLKKVTPEAFREQKRQVSALSMLLPTLHDWIVSWKLGTSFETVYRESLRLLFHHIQQASMAQEGWIEDLISAYRQGNRADYSQEQLRARLAEILTQEDWQAIAAMATQEMKQRILQHSLQP